MLREALENQSNLSKNLPSGEVVANSDEFLKNLLAQVSNSEKVHTEYLFQNGHTLEQLPHFSSINFKCQEEKGLKKSLVFRHRFGKILLNKIYNCVLFENFNKLFCY